MSKDITIYFTHFAAYSQKIYHESFVTRNCIPWWNIDFARSYVIQHSKRNSKEEFDLLQHTKQIPFFEFFVCQYDQNQNYNYLIHSSNYNHIIYESNSNNDSDYIFVDEESTNQHNNYISITKFLYDNNINSQQFYLKFNEIDSINMVHEYEYPLNGDVVGTVMNPFTIDIVQHVNKFSKIVIANLFAVSLLQPNKKTKKTNTISSKNVNGILQIVIILIMIVPK
ncbi:hypothetical protein F8M41_026370 [Gigaspora margarita]|uniref:Uncharacterized protein n=1 Tax=Gigaspora margarita TaxID=4874 RepID=A0A8H4AAC4_GIGMA|nr:hypothetical protein F8M41_026370 [Gigaspora margarita]